MKEGEKIDKYFCQRTKKAGEYEGDDDTNCNWCVWNGPKKLGKKTGRMEIRGRIKTIQAIAFLDQLKYSEESWRPKQRNIFSFKIMNLFKRFFQFL